ncbi:hypothetical protein B0H13DRAFT_2281143 [Mycena leptocephala]|nr:hypothetical protein B0H13DRAFT_2281143 [Mycena leptocephala]
MSYHRDFVPEGCSLAQPAATLGVANTGTFFALAGGRSIGGGVLVIRPQDNDVTAGSDRTVGVVGGWLQVKPCPGCGTFHSNFMFSNQGGGHGVLSNTMGFRVDRVLQSKVMTPDGELGVANACQNQDLFFAWEYGHADWITREQDKASASLRTLENPSEPRVVKLKAVASRNPASDRRRTKVAQLVSYLCIGFLESLRWQTGN